MGIFKKLLLSSVLNVLLLLVPVALLGKKLFGFGDVMIFWLNFLSILPLAKLLGTATESLASQLGDTLGGLLNASFGNAVEMILAVFALQEGLVSVVQTSLLGSILSNLLLVLGMCFFFGGVKYHEQRYNPLGARIQSGLLLTACMAIVIPTMVTAKHADTLIVSLSRGTAIALAVSYVCFIGFQLVTHKDYFIAALTCESNWVAEDEEEEEEIEMPSWLATVLLFVVTLAVAACSEGLVASVEGLTEKCHISKPFVGMILLPIVGNAAEHLTAVTVAMKNKMDLSLGVALGSSLQIALLVVPFTVIVGWIIDVPMHLNFGPVGSGVLMSSILIVGKVTSDGESNYLEGAMLLGAYMLIALTYWGLEEH